MEQVLVKAEALAVIVDHARADAPRECCGLLIGRPGEILRASPTRNARASATAFLVDPRDHFDALRLARAAGFAIVGAYHSHPSSEPEPSPRDIDEAVYDDFLHLIVGLREGDAADVRAFRFAAGNFTPVVLVPDVD